MFRSGGTNSILKSLVKPGATETGLQEKLLSVDHLTYFSVNNRTKV